ncbi:Ser/Thr protein phosphatase, putative [Trichomonas vaginalis G3]|uniref:Ser/Thr protein phosphatase, putative n=1 Tax=Trichomonas vaginalis (strain ATCC PRA-98 / G3) TaxID=412133 RepID=A2ECB0_TRIV3|nr:double-strand break repair protein, MRE11-like [Trichomonas vaginalis G3]EAY09694.1 Ser/Thr protein phosphatase, putative [Trichomonas vaginalis G3]KAI5533958.1 double-strand break repair protein, MRE11-like [Trichomonas vaginalis G3]|eukprot:XP_001321917.1 Ser/Thr protein phosphatase [Trichomonas vaginalis G3]
MGESQQDTFKIAIFTDTHIGYDEQDAITEKDSFRAFKECVQNAHIQNADIILHAGDFFNERNPSRYAVIKTMKILDEFVIGQGNPPEILYSEGLSSDPNWLNPNINIKIPFFCMHGNHDAPNGLGSTSPIQLLSVSKYLNFFKPVDIKETIELQPIVLKRGTIRVVVYGLGYIFEEKFKEVVMGKKLKLIAPEEGEFERTYTILMIHQNMSSYDHDIGVMATRLSDAIWSETNPHNVDLVIWGHEHENLIQRKKYGNIYVTQPGSTVYTQFRKKNAMQRSMAILTISQNPDFDKFEEIKLESPRTFIYDKIEIDNKGLGFENDKLNYIKEQIDDKLLEFMDKDGKTIPKRQRPIMRIDVESTLSPSSLNLRGLVDEYKELVANPTKMFRYVVKKANSGTKQSEKAEKQTSYISEQEHIKIEDILSQKISPSDLNFISFDSLKDSLMEYINSDNMSKSKAFENNINAVFNERINYIIEQSKNKQKEVYDANKAKEFILNQKENLPTVKKENIAEIKGKKKTSAQPSPQKPSVHQESEEEKEVIEEEPKRTVERPKRPRRKATQ